jgi:hypothetical protein
MEPLSESNVRLSRRKVSTVMYELPELAAPLATI